TVYFRLIDTSTVSIGGATVTTAGTNRIDNFEVDAVPEPGTWAAAGLTAAFMACAERRRIARYIRRKRTAGMAELEPGA
ncbi:MAG: PEP-CTERM sorting domain-containing protein, partial [Verrucomicrobia bacterium]|nr:PEP-CTERM sorting domain-containing protein [Verrucomicrobiota bacterium]